MSLEKLKGGAGLSIIQVTLMNEEPQSQVYDMLTEESDDEHTEVADDAPTQDEKTDKQNHKNREKEETTVEKDKAEAEEKAKDNDKEDNNMKAKDNEKDKDNEKEKDEQMEEGEEEEEEEEGEEEESEKEEEEEEEKEESEKEEEKEESEEKAESEEKYDDDSDYVASDVEMLTPKKTTKGKRQKKPKLIVKGSRKRVNAPSVPDLNDTEDMEKTDEEESDNESEITEINEQTGFPVYKSKVSKHGQLHMSKNKLVYVTKENDTMQDVETVVSGVKFKGGCVIHIPGVEFEVYTGKPKGRPPKGKQWDDSAKQWVEKPRSFNNFQTSLETLAKAVKRKLENDFDDGKKAKAVRF